MKTSARLLAFAALALAAPCFSPAAIVLYDGGFSGQDVTNVNGSSSSSYNPSALYSLQAYNSTNVTYTEIDTGGGDNRLQFTNNLGTVGGRDAILRYSFTPSQVKNYANAATPADPLLGDIAANPVLSFDIAFTGRQTTGTWAVVYINIESQTPGVASRDLLSQNVVFGETANITFNFSESVVWNAWLSEMGTTTATLALSQLRITVQTSPNEWGTFTIDNIQLAPVPEPASFAALGGLTSLGLVTMRRRRR